MGLFIPAVAVLMTRLIHIYSFLDSALHFAEAFCFPYYRSWAKGRKKNHPIKLGHISCFSACCNILFIARYTSDSFIFMNIFHRLKQELCCFTIHNWNVHMSKIKFLSRLFFFLPFVLFTFLFASLTTQRQPERRRSKELIWASLRYTFNNVSIRSLFQTYFSFCNKTREQSFSVFSAESKKKKMRFNKLQKR